MLIYFTVKKSVPIGPHFRAAWQLAAARFSAAMVAVRTPRFELGTSTLSGWRSNQLSYRSTFSSRLTASIIDRLVTAGGGESQQREDRDESKSHFTFLLFCLPYLMIIPWGWPVCMRSGRNFHERSFERAVNREHSRSP